MIPYHKIFGRLGNQMFQGAYIFAQHKRGKIEDIYMQDPEYFEGFEDEIRDLYGKDIGHIDRVAVHVRRGDYVRNPFYVDLTRTAYYENALAQFKGEKFLIFSDDREFCEEYFDGEDYEFDEHEGDIDALNTMASCKGIIIANSSFSWWAAFLGDKNKKVVAPMEWYTDGEERTKLPDEWIRL